ncbi:MAG: hypothetical protein ACXVCM_14235 [Ktedonobacteraceae bacterium]
MSFLQQVKLRDQVEGAPTSKTHHVQKHAIVERKMNPDLERDVSAISSIRIAALLERLLLRVYTESSYIDR